MTNNQRVVKIYSGKDSTAAAHQLNIATQERRNDWPYAHVFPPYNADDVFKIGTAPTDAADGSTQTTILEYKVNSGKTFYLQAVILGANVTFNPGDVEITVARNFHPGIPDTQFQPEHGLVNTSVQIGSFLQGAFRLERAREFGPLDVVSVTGTNFGLPVGAPTFYVCGLFGYELPVLDVRAHR